MSLPDFDGPPIQAFTTAGLLIDFADVRVSLTLRDGTILIGVLRSYDEFGSLVLQDAVERIFHNGKFAERELGVWIIRGETVALLGRIDPERDSENEALVREKWQHTDFSSLEKERDADREKFNEERGSRIAEGLQLGLVGTKLSGNPYEF